MNDSLTIANEALTVANNGLFTANNLWILVAAVLVFIMHLGFATLEAGLFAKKMW